MSAHHASPFVGIPLACLLVFFGPGIEMLRAETTAAPIILTREGRTQYLIELPMNPSASQVFAATELQKYLKQISSAFLPIRRHDTGSTTGRIRLVDAGRNAPLGDEGFFIRTDGADLLIGGSAGRGIIYGVYTFLEHLGCRWYSPGCELIPYTPTIRIPALDVAQIPDYEYREPWYMVAWDVDWAVKNKVNGIGPELDDVRGGRVEFASRYYCHTFDLILPADKHLAGHPDWYSLVDGQRVGGQYKGQLCLTNTQMREVFTGEVRRVIAENPDMQIMSVSQNDNRNHCQCENCRQVDVEEGSPAGLMVRFANQIAEAISNDHPDVLIHTFAYQYTEQPPRITTPDPNVVIMLCPIQCCQYHRYDQCPHNEAFLNNLQRWSTLTKRLYIWHYNTNFRHYLLPFPDLRQLPHSLKLYREHHVKGLIAQGMEPGGRGFMDELKSYLVAKLLWDSSLDSKAIRTEFMHAYFAEAADSMDAFLRLLHDRVSVEGIHGTCFDDLGLTGRSHPFSPGGKAVPLMTDGIVAHSRRLFAEAKAMVRDPAVLARLERVEFSLDYFETMRGFHQAAEGIARADAWRQVQALADRSRQLGFAEWTMGRGSIERRLETMKATFDLD